MFDGSHYLTLNYSKKAAWDITMSIGGEEAQPAIPVYVQIPLPEDFDENRVVVFHVNSQTGKLERVESEVKDGYICFYAFFFSVYIIADKSTEIEQAPSVDCDHLWHKTGFLDFIRKIIKFFCKFFNASSLCSCGAAHY